MPHQSGKQGLHHICSLVHMLEHCQAQRLHQTHALVPCVVFTSDMSLVTNGLYFSQCPCWCQTISDSVMQPIRVETAAGQVYTAIMHTVDMDASIEDIRMTAMYIRSPIHTLMFSSKGALLGANSSALEACRVHTPGRKAVTVFQTHPELYMLFGCWGRMVSYVT